jgi:glycogen operon protein
MRKPQEVMPGKSFPLGATVYPEGVNFCVFSKSCDWVELLLFNTPNDNKPAKTYRLDPDSNRTFYYWHIFINDLKPGQLYGYRVHGPFEPEIGNLYDYNKVLVDPYAKGVVTGKCYSREAAIRPWDNCREAMKCVIVDNTEYDWEGDKQLNIPYADSIIYEMHVAGFTKHPSSGVAPHKKGTYAGLIEKIPYLQDLGITAVELMPVQQFDFRDAIPPLTNYWGYSPVAFFAPHYSYSSDTSPLGPVNEFRDMVKAFHKAGIEVILDVVFNHTAEGTPQGPVFSFKGFENKAYYILKEDKRFYADYTGTGNTVNTNHSIVRRLIRDCLRYWVAEMHVDGFRFDLASVLSRDENGIPLENPPILWEIESDPVLAGTKLIAEAWDAAGLFQVGSFIGDKWAEWNSHYRDDVRSFMKGDKGTVTRFASRILGSPDIYTNPKREVNRSIHFVTCHDGFTMNDLVSYNNKHNQANGEKNKDGSDFNHSWNSGIEGPTNNNLVEKIRHRQVKNFLTILFFSQGTPMLLMGDEIRRTQLGNNNAYCQDNELSWFDWSLLEKNHQYHRFTRKLIQFTKSKNLFRLKTNLQSKQDQLFPYITWHGVELRKPDLGENSHSLAFTLHHPASLETLHVIVNSYWEDLKFKIPPLPAGERWCKVVDTSLPEPHDFTDLEDCIPMLENSYLTHGRSVVVLMAVKK